jgi:hypothetical protein
LKLFAPEPTKLSPKVVITKERDRKCIKSPATFTFSSLLTAFATMHWQPLSSTPHSSFRHVGLVMLLWQQLMKSLFSEHWSVKAHSPPLFLIEHLSLPLSKS